MPYQLPTIAIAGNLTADPELRATANGRSVASCTIAANKGRTNQAGQWEKTGDLFVRCTVWGKLAEHLCASAAKGTPVIAIGELETQHWQDETGAKHSSIQMTVRDIGLGLNRGPLTLRDQPQAPAGGFAAPAPTPGQPAQPASAWTPAYVPPEDDPWGVPPPAQSQDTFDEPEF